MALLNASVLSKDALSVLGEQSALIGASTIQPISNIGTGTNYMEMRLPAKFIARTNKTWNGSEIDEKAETLVLSKVYGADFFISDSDLALTVQDFSSLYIKPAISAIVTELERDFYANALSKAGYTKDGSKATSLDDLFDLSTEQTLRGVTMSDRSYIGDARLLNGIYKQGRGIFNSQTELASQYTAGIAGEIGGYNVWGTGRMPVYKTVTNVGSLDVTAVEGSDELVIESATLSNMPVGSAFTISGIYELSPTTRENLGVLKVFRVVDVKSGNVVKVDEKLYSTGAYANVSSLPTTLTALTITAVGVDNQIQAIAFPKEAVILGFVKLPAGSQTPGVESEWMEEDGVGVRVMKWFDGDAAKLKVRIDAQCGILVPRSELVASIVAD